MLKCLSFCHDCFSRLGKLFHRKARITSKFMTSSTEKQIIKIHILANIPRSKGNQTVKFDLLIEYNIRNIFLEKSYLKCGGKTSQTVFEEKIKLSISLDQQSEILCGLLLLYFHVKDYQNIMKLRYGPLLPYLKFFQKTGQEVVSLPNFLQDIWGKVFPALYSIDSPNFIFWLPLLHEVLRYWVIYAL